EIEQDHPGDCPKCGMPLEPKFVQTAEDAEEEGSHELKSLQRKLWISAALALPVFVLAMGEMIPALRVREWMPEGAFGWVQMILATLVVFGPGGFIFIKAWRSLQHRSLNMFTLIALGVGAA